MLRVQVGILISSFPLAYRVVMDDSRAATDQTVADFTANGRGIELESESMKICSEVQA